MYIYIVFNYIEDQGAAHLGNWLKEDPKLKKLDIGIEIFASLNDISCKYLGHNPISENGIQTICESLNSNTHLKALALCIAIFMIYISLANMGN